MVDCDSFIRHKGSHGDVEVGLASLQDLPYVMGLVRQSLEKQMGNAEETVEQPELIGFTFGEE